MSVEKSPEPSHHETIALIADKLAVERSDGAELAPVLLSLPKVSDGPTVQVVPERTSALQDTALPPPIPPAPPPPRIDPFVTDLSPQPPQPASMPPVATAISAGATPAAAAPVAAAASRPPAGAATAAVETMSHPKPSRMLFVLPICIALFALGMSIYQGMLFRESIDVMQRNVARGEYARTCREIIETYFQIKPRVGALMPTPDRSNVAGASRVTETARLDAQAAIAKFGGLGTYLANFQDAGTRARYTELTKTLSGIYDNARNTKLADIDTVFAPADKLFNQMNDDCVRLSRAVGI